jgi:hypothetical protein
MDTLAGARMTLPLPDPTGRSFAQLDQAERDRLGALLRPLTWIDGLIAGTAVSPTDGSRVEADDLADWLMFSWSEEKADEVGADAGANRGDRCAGDGSLPSHQLALMSRVLSAHLPASAIWSRGAMGEWLPHRHQPARRWVGRR